MIALDIQMSWLTRFVGPQGLIFGKVARILGAPDGIELVRTPGVHSGQSWQRPLVLMVCQVGMDAKDHGR